MDMGSLVTVYGMSGQWIWDRRTSHIHSPSVVTIYGMVEPIRPPAQVKNYGSREKHALRAPRGLCLWDEGSAVKH